ncbi:MAG TPA: cell division protein ZapE [Rudaea sp.]|nr:cell division protein ZapE [Rudaea sp.]
MASLIRIRMLDEESTALSPSQRYAAGVAEQRWQDDPAQRDALRSLDRIHAQSLSVSGHRHWSWRHLRMTQPAPVRGLYLWGAVGRGKTFLVDLLFEALPTQRKLRLHFHRFMGRVHAGLSAAQGRRDPLRDVAAGFAAQARVLCLDEFLVTDIGDAMLLGRLLRHLFADGVCLVTTANIAPENLYRDGLQRARFLPAIDLLQQHCDVLELISPYDYRLRALTQSGVYFCPLGERAEQALAHCFDRIAPDAHNTQTAIKVNGRTIPVKRRAEGVIWFDFAALCEGPRAVADYIELAQSFNSVLLSGVPQFTPQIDNAARRFINLVDEFYDHGVNLIVSAAATPIDLYAGQRLRAEFERTQSRLIEMQSEQYLALAHRH